MADGSLIFDTKVDTSGFTQGTNTIKRQAGGLTSVFKKLGVAMAAAFAVKRLVQVGAQAIELASDIQEVQNVVDTAFGDMAYKMEEFADASIDMYGISKLAAKRTGSTFMAMAASLRLSMDEASDMSLALTALSANMASFYNIEQDVASTALKSIFTGETEPLKQYSVVMTEVNLNEFALASGITKTYNAMSQREKVMLRYNYVTQQMALAQGDFARTSGSWANQTRVLSERWKEFLSIIGSGLIRILTPVVRYLNLAMSKMITMAQTASNIANALFGTANAEQEVAASGSDAADSIGSMAEETVEASEEIDKSLTSFDELNTLASDTADSASDINFGSLDTGSTTTAATVEEIKVEDKLGPVVEELQGKLERFRVYLSGIFLPVFDDVKELWTKLSDLLGTEMPKDLKRASESIKGVVGGIGSIFETVFTGIWEDAVNPMLNTFIDDGLPTLVGIKDEIWTTLETLYEDVDKTYNKIYDEVISPVLTEIAKIWDGLWDGIKKTWDKYGKPIFDALNDAIRNTKKVFSDNWENYLKPIWDNFMETVDDLWTNHLKPLWDELCEFVAALVLLALDIYNNVIAPIVDWIVVNIGPVVAAFVNNVIDFAGDIIRTVTNLVRRVIRIFTKITTFLSDVFTGDWESAWNGVKDIFGEVFEGLKDLARAPINAIIGMVNDVIEAINKLGANIPLLSELGEEVSSGKISNRFNNAASTSAPLLSSGTQAPLSTYSAIKGMTADEVLDVVNKATAATAQSTASQDVTIKFTGTMSELVRQLKPEIDKETKRVGTKLVTTGGVN